MSISVERLLYELDQGSAFWEELQDKHTLQSLLEVAEAAHELQRGARDPAFAVALAPLRYALDRFDFSRVPNSQASPE